MIILGAVRRLQQYVLRKNNRERDHRGVVRLMHLLEPLFRLADKGHSNGGLHWDVNAITLSAFKKMKHLAIIAALLRKAFM